MALTEIDMRSGVVTLLVDRGVNRGGGLDLMRILPWARFQSGADTEPNYIVVPIAQAMGLLADGELLGPNFGRVRQEEMRHVGMPLEPPVADNGVTALHFFGDV